MIPSKEILAVIPARCGSKRVPLKNIQPLLGRPLLEYTVQAALKSGAADRVVVSTDCREIAVVAEKSNAEVIMRPAELAGDEASTESVLLHAVDRLEAEGHRYEWVLTLPPTSPLRTAQTIRRFMEEFQSSPRGQDCFMSVTETRDDFWQKQTDGTLRRLFPDAPRRQQERSPLYVENSAIYMTSVSALRSTGSILGKSVRGWAMDPIEAVDINSTEDFHLAESLLQRAPLKE